MIVKEREYPFRAILDEILLRRLPLIHPKRPIIAEDLRKYQSGYRGEKSLDYYLKFLPDDEYYIFQSLRLTYKNIIFQMDFLLLSAHFALIIEAKNYKGTLRFDSHFDQLIQTYQETEKAYENPVSQAKRQQSLLTKWLKDKTSLTLPIDFLVVMTNPNAILKTDPGNYEVLKKICKPHKLTDKIASTKKQHTQTPIDQKTLKKLSKLLIKHHTPPQFNILDVYKISKDEILPGVICPKCGALPMEYKPRSWHCPVCKTTSQDAHLNALHDYFLLIDHSITNAELRNFLHLPSRNAAQKILTKLNLTSTGQTKGKIYYFKPGDQIARR
ncbi:NERD domain-containing protein [Bacillota bacterium Lsc_1132]